MQTKRNLKDMEKLTPSDIADVKLPTKRRNILR
jgi:hypothetical protein